MTDLNQPPRLWVSQDGAAMIDLEHVVAILMLPNGIVNVYTSGDAEPIELDDDEGKSIMQAFRDYRTVPSRERL